MNLKNLPLPELEARIRRAKEVSIAIILKTRGVERTIKALEAEFKIPDPYPPVVTAWWTSFGCSTVEHFHAAEDKVSRRRSLIGQRSAISFSKREHRASRIIPSRAEPPRTR